MAKKKEAANPLDNLGLSDVELTQEEQNYFKSQGKQAPPGVSDEPPPEEEPEPEKPESEPPPKAAEAEDPPKEEPEKPKKDETPEEEAERKNVPLHVLMAEKERRKEAEESRRQLEERVRKYEDQQARIDERLRMAREQRELEEKQEYEKRIPDPEDDPLGYERAMREQAEARIERIEQQMRRSQEMSEQERQQLQAREYMQTVMGQVQGMTQRFAANHPDYYQAAEHYSKARDREMERMGYPQEERQQLLQREAEYIIGGAMRAGHNPAQVIYELAQERGYKPANGSSQPSQQTTERGQEEDQLERVRKGVEASKSIGTTSGMPEETGLTFEKLATMPEDKFMRIYRENPEMVEAIMKGE